MKLLRARNLDGSYTLRLQDGTIIVHCVVEALECRNVGAVRRILVQMFGAIQDYYKYERRRILAAGGDLDDREAVNL